MLDLEVIVAKRKAAKIEPQRTLNEQGSEMKREPKTPITTDQKGGIVAGTTVVKIGPSATSAVTWKLPVEACNSKVAMPPNW